MTLSHQALRLRPHRLLRLLPVLLMMWLPVTPGSAQDSPATLLGEYTLDTHVINESSGLARSQRRNNLLWTLNDSGGETALYGVTTTGHHVATLNIRGREVMNYDWEDLASYHHDGHDYLLIGDMGDNFAWRSSLSFYLVREPRLGSLPDHPRTLTADIQRRFRVIYPDGARDAEALAVDARENMAYVISKRDARPALYRFSLRAGQPEPIVMEALGPIDIPRAPEDYVGNPNSFNWVTTMDFDDALTRAYVGTLTTGYFYERAPDESWARALTRPPTAFNLPAYPQIEGGTFARHQRDNIYVSSEQLPARLARIRP